MVLTQQVGAPQVNYRETIAMEARLITSQEANWWFWSIWSGCWAY